MRSTRIKVLSSGAPSIRTRGLPTLISIARDGAVAGAGIDAVGATSVGAASIFMGNRATGSYSPACSARRHLNTKLVFGPCSIARRATEIPGSLASLAISRRNSSGWFGMPLRPDFFSASVVKVVPTTRLWWGLLWQLLVRPSRRYGGLAYDEATMHAEDGARKNARKAHVRRCSRSVLPVSREHRLRNAYQQCVLAPRCRSAWTDNSESRPPARHHAPQTTCYP